MGCRLTADQLDQFDSEGWAIVDGVFTADECDTLVDHLEGAALTLDLGHVEDGQMQYRPMLHLTDAFLREVACDSRWEGIVLPIVGPDARLYWEQAVSRAPGTGTELPWHQDNGYTPVIPESYLTCWLALDDADAGNGGLQVIPGSHRLGTARHRNDGDNPYFRVGSDAPPDAGVSMTVTKGSVLVFSSLLMHRSGPNTSVDRPRRAWILQYCHADAVSGLSRKRLDNRLRVAEGGTWLERPYRDSDFDLLSVLANYDSTSG